MSDDRYREIARSLRTMGWLQDALLRRARKRVVEHLRDRGAATVLDAGCGAGTLSRYLSDAGLSAIAVDRSPAMLALARRRAPHAQCLRADLTRLVLGQPVDGAVVALSLHEMTEDRRVEVWSALQRLTRRNGPLVLMDYTPPTRHALSRLAGWIIHMDERGLDRFDPGHFQNFKGFLARGGAHGWLQRQGQTIVADDRFLFGNLAVLVTSASPDRLDVA